MAFLPDCNHQLSVHTIIAKFLLFGHCYQKNSIVSQIDHLGFSHFDRQNVPSGMSTQITRNKALKLKISILSPIEIEGVLKTISV